MLQKSDPFPLAFYLSFIFAPAPAVGRWFWFDRNGPHPSVLIVEFNMYLFSFLHLCMNILFIDILFVMIRESWHAFGFYQGWRAMRKSGECRNSGWRQPARPLPAGRPVRRPDPIGPSPPPRPVSGRGGGAPRTRSTSVSKGAAPKVSTSFQSYKPPSLSIGLSRERSNYCERPLMFSVDMI